MATQPPIEPVIVSLAEVKSESVQWLWDGRIALGKVTLIAGDPGLGKSFLTLDIASRVSCGKSWPDGASAIVGGVVLLSAEDDLADTIRPRLDAAGADVNRINALVAVRLNYTDDPLKESSFSLGSHSHALEAAIQKVPECRLVIIDPITAFLGATDSHKNAEIRGVLAPLAALAAKYGVAVVCVTHLNKSAGGPAIYRAIGSIAFAAAARAVWAVVKDKVNPQRRLMLPMKNNLAPDALGLAYTIEPNGPDRAPVVVWETDPVEMSADDAIGTYTGTTDASDDVKQAAAWLRTALKDGGMPSTAVLQQGRSNGFSDKLLRKAFESLGGKSHKQSFAGGWTWSLPSDEHAGPSEKESSTSSKKHGESSKDSAPATIEDSQDAQDFKRADSGDVAGEWGTVP